MASQDTLMEYCCDVAAMGGECLCAETTGFQVWVVRSSFEERNERVCYEVYLSCPIQHETGYWRGPNGQWPFLTMSEDAWKLRMYPHPIEPDKPRRAKVKMTTLWEHDEWPFWCQKCKQKTARKVPDTYGWEGSCLHCGVIERCDVLDMEPT
jgi:hypothetical protein